ncbi:MAG: hypothetical protein PUP91_13695 [Rhizonema sp. PD37]|nr:hypothetical protein [Rhizonema sp. PD37]
MWVIKAQEHNLDVPKLYEDFQDKVTQWVKVLAHQAKLLEGTIIAKVNIKKQEILKESQGFGFILKSLRSLFSQ